MFSTRVPPHLKQNRLASTLAERRARGEPIIDLTESNPTRAGFEYPRDLLAPLADPATLRYDPQPLGAMGARVAVSREYERQGALVPPERIVLTASTSDAYSLLFKLLADAGDEILTPRPSYPLFEHLTQLDLIVGRPYDLEYHGSWSMDLAGIDSALSSFDSAHGRPRVRAVLVVSPNNPTGSFVSRDQIVGLANLCAPRDVAIVADEVFFDYELEDDARGTAGRALDCGNVLSFTLGGLSKSVGLPQVKLGWIAVNGPGPLAAAALERLELICDTYLSVSTPAQTAAAHLLAAGAPIRRQITDRVRANYAALQAWAYAVPSCRVLRADAGWYAVIQVPALEPEEDLVVGLLARDGVLVHPGYFFDFSRESYVIVSLLPRPADFAEGIGRLLRRFDCRPATT